MKGISKSSICIVAGLLAACVLCAPSRADIYRVDVNVQNPGQGGTWAAAFDDLEGALYAAEQHEDEDEIWVAEGTYYPSEEQIQYDPRSVAFNLDDEDPVKIYGGFAGTEDYLYERDIYANPTILSGDLDQDDDYTTFPDDIWIDRDDNAYHVITGSATTDPMDGARVDGFTIIGGTADGVYDLWGGGASNGGDMYVRCTFCWNRAKTGGGAFVSADNDVIIYNCRFYNNIAAEGDLDQTRKIGREGAIFLGRDVEAHIIDGDFNVDESADQLIDDISASR